MSRPVAPAQPVEVRDVPPARRDERRKLIRQWWQSLQPQRPDGTPNRDADRGALARLRRAATPLDILDEEAVFDLHRRLRFGRGKSDETLVQVAIAASVLAGVREHDPERKPARAAGRKTFGDRELETAALSPGRLRRLLAAREPEEVHRQMRRLVHLCGPAMDVGALAVLILDWFDEERGRRTRTRFAYDYYAASGSLAGPETESPPPAA